MSTVPIGYRGALRLAGKFDSNPLLKALLAVPMPQQDGTIAFRAVPPQLQLTTLARAGFRVPLNESQTKSHGVSSVFWLLRLLNTTETLFESMGVPALPTEAASSHIAPNLNVSGATRRSLLVAHPTNLDDAFFRGAFIANAVGGGKKPAMLLQINQPSDSPVGDILSRKNRNAHPRLCSLPLHIGGSDGAGAHVIHSNHLMHYLLSARRNPLSSKVPAEPFYVSPISAILQLPPSVVNTLNSRNCRVISKHHEVPNLSSLTSSGDFMVAPPLIVPDLLRTSDEWASALSRIGGMGPQCGFLPPLSQPQRAAIRERRRSLLGIEGVYTPAKDKSEVFLTTVSTLLSRAH